MMCVFSSTYSTYSSVAMCGLIILTTQIVQNKEVNRRHPI